MSVGRSRLDVKADRLSSEALDQRGGGFWIDDEVQVAKGLLEPGEQARIHPNTLEDYGAATADRAGPRPICTDWRRTR